VSTLWQDLRFALRFLAKNATFAAVAALTLALGIGANSAIFTVVNAVLLKPLPYREPDRLATIWLDNRRLGLKEDLTSYPNFQDWKAGSPSFASMAAFTDDRSTISGIDEPERVDGALVEANFFEVMGVAPQKGRVFSAAEETPGQDAVVIISDGLWRRRFGAAADVVGKQLRLDSRTFTVVGVMPAEFRFPSKKCETWLPLALDPQSKASRSGFFLSVVGRLKPGARFETAQAELNAVASRIEQQFPNLKGYGAYSVPLEKQLVGGVRLALLVLAGAVAFVLLIACTNVAGLFLARAESREREIAVRTALGAGRGRLIRQLLTESVVLAIGAGIVGLVFAYWATGALAHGVGGGRARCPSDGRARRTGAGAGGNRVGARGRVRAHALAFDAVVRRQQHRSSNLRGCRRYSRIDVSRRELGSGVSGGEGRPDGGASLRVGSAYLWLTRRPECRLADSGPVRMEVHS